MTTASTPGSRERVEQRGLPRVRVAHQRHRRHRGRFSTLPLLRANAAHILDLLLYVPHPPRNFPPVGFQLRFAGTARSDAAAQLRHLDAASSQARQHVLQLRQFDLQLAFAGSRMTRKDIEDELRAVDHPPLNNLLDIALLRRTTDRDRTAGRRHSPKRQCPRSLPVCRRRSGLPDQAGLAAAEFVPQLWRPRSRPTCEVPPSDSSASNSGMLGLPSDLAELGAPSYRVFCEGAGLRARPAACRVRTAAACASPFPCRDGSAPRGPPGTRVRAPVPCGAGTSRRAHAGLHASCRGISCDENFAKPKSLSYPSVPEALAAVTGVAAAQPPSPDAAHGSHASTPLVPSPQSRWHA